MFRLSSMLQRNHMISHQRFFSKVVNEKSYIINTRDQEKKFVFNSEIIQKFCNHAERQKLDLKCKRWNWERLIRTAKQLLLRSHQHSVVLLKRYEVQEKLVEFKNKQFTHLQQKISKAPEILKKQMEVIKASDGYKKTINLPHQIIPHFNNAVVKSCHYYKVFTESQFKAYLDKTIISLWINGKIYTLKFFKFIREAYFEKP